jgi:DNA-binding PucR family transcriptional regulator
VTKLQAEIIVALADNQMNVSEAAREIFMHRNTVKYHIRKIYKLTGKDPLDFYDMCELLPVAQQMLNGISERTRNALYAIGRMTHSGDPE